LAIGYIVGMWNKKKLIKKEKRKRLYAEKKCVQSNNRVLELEET
jgi:hypothetical protein